MDPSISKSTNGELAPLSLDAIRKTRPLVDTVWDICKAFPETHTRLAELVFRLEPGILVKFSWNGSHMRDEVACISFVRKNTTIPTPCLLFRPRRRTEYICIEEIAGVTLESQLEHMTIPELDCVASQLRSHIGQLRKLESRGISSVNGGPLRSCYLWDPPKQPLRKVGEFNQHLREAFRRVYRSSERGDRIVECFPMNSAITFTHGDIGPQNIILQGSTVFLIDWGVSGWWPEYWEYCRMRQ